MPRSENQKLKILYVAKYFMEYSDENHPVSAREIKEYLLDECNIEADCRSIYRDINLLRDEFGMDIDGGQGKKYRLLSRQFEFDDLRILAECVYSAKFISKTKAKELVETISEFCSTFQAESLQSEVFLCDRVKTTQKGIMISISKINAAMAKKLDGQPHTPQKISFKYLKCSINHLESQVERRGGARYVVSPYKLLINEGNYYLLAFDDKSQAMRRYRVDRMKDIQLLNQPRDGAEAFEQVDMENYTRRVFSMFEGEKKHVRIRFALRYLDAVYERFGTGFNTSYIPEGDHHFIIATDVDISDLFFSWVCGFRNGAEILSPSEVVNGMKDFLRDITNKYQSE